MTIELFNDRIELDLEEVDSKVISKLKKSLVWKNKSIDYQLKQIEQKGRVPKGVDLEDLKGKLEGKYYDERNGKLILPAGFAHLFEKYPRVVDHHGTTGYVCSFGFRTNLPMLRPYQCEAVEKALEVNRGVVCLATGMGKTLLSVSLIQKYSRNTLVIVPNKNIGKQFFDVLVKYFGEDQVGFIGDSKCDVKNITVGIIQSVLNKIDSIPEVGMIIIDETHHVPAFTLFDIMKRKANTGKVIGLSATPFRSDGLDNHIMAIAGRNIIEYGAEYGIENGFLAKPTFLIRKVPTRGKDNKEKIWAMKAHVTGSDTMKAVAMKDIKGAIASGKSVLILVPTIEFGKEISEEVGCPFATGDDKKSYEYLEQFNSGSLKCLCGTSSKIGEGSDTVRVDILIMLSFPGSKGPMLQQIGRGLRLYEGKSKVVIIDYIPMGSTILSRHANTRIDEYRKLGEVRM